jgi:hypothetical protein
LVNHTLRFDNNEWAIIIAILINILIFRLLPKRLPKEITPLIVLLSMSYPKILDHTMAVNPFNLYDIMDTDRYEFFDLALYGVYPAFGYLFIYLLDSYNPKGIKLVLYFITWSVVSIGMEFLLVNLHVFVYTGWKLIYSLPIYLVVLVLTYLFYQLLKYYRVKKPLLIKGSE